MSKVYTHNDFTLRDPCTYGDNNWCGYADGPHHFGAATPIK